MQPIERVLEEIRALHERIGSGPTSESAPQASQSIPPGVDPVSYALEEVARLRQAVERTCGAAPPEETTRWTPRVSVFAGEAKAKLLIEIPGVCREDVTVTSAGGELVVRGERKPCSVDGDLEPIVDEQTWGTFERRFRVPDWCTPDSIRASCANGVLEISITRTENAAHEFQIEVR